ncbi:MAG: pyruvate, phosphate dikinase [Actinobacteria bacterium]|uniref:pyruvate, phosphate dikinase n=1 Tax=freshwater metagenome TaxID=449393 RepID=A0A6J6DFX9_9ZZZZ|nr:pyruvate, phosphate dikinase [Actinomycetota bacterium]
MDQKVYAFSEGNRTMSDLLGGKGANLAEMASLGIPVPDGFTITTEVCQEYLRTGGLGTALLADIDAAVVALEKKIGKSFGDPTNPLLVSVRSGAKFSMPGMMETVLNVGMSKSVASTLAKQTGDDRFAWDSYRRFIEMFGKTVCEIPGDVFTKTAAPIIEAAGGKSMADLGGADLEKVGDAFVAIVEKHTGAPFPFEARSQMLQAIEAVFHSWNSDRAQLYRRRERISADLGTAVNVQAMVFGNIGDTSGTGVCFTRDPGSGAQGAYGDYLPRAQGEDVVAGIRNAYPLTHLGEINPEAYAELQKIMALLENHYRDMCDIEFTVEKGKLWILQTRVGKRTAEAAFRIATQLVDEGAITMDQALTRVDGEQLVQLMFPQFDKASAPRELTRGIAASPGAAVGAVVFDPRDAADQALAGKKVILVRRETNPDDLVGMVAAQGILTARGGKTSHAAVVARGMGRPAVCGTESIEVNVDEKYFLCGDTKVVEGDVISIDGTTGAVFLGEVAVVPSVVTEYVQGIVDPGAATSSALIRSIHRIITHADQVRRMSVRANADTPEDAEIARRMGAQGIGLTRTEHMFLGDRRVLVETLVLATTDEERTEVLAEMEKLQFSDFVGILRAMTGLPVTVRLLDPPLHEFLTDQASLAVEIALLQERGEVVDERKLALNRAVNRLHESNPMMGLRGVRLGVLIPDLFSMQVRALTRAALHVRDQGYDPQPEIMIPLVASQRELLYFRSSLEDEVARVLKNAGKEMHISIGSMIETPRAAITAAKLSDYSDFFSFGTNDLTQLTWAFSRDDVESSFLPRYLDLELLPFSPFESLDQDGVGLLVKIACDEIRGVAPEMKLGICGEHGGDPRSIDFFHNVGLDYVSCSPFRVPVARLEAGRAAVSKFSTTTSA